MAATIGRPSWLLPGAHAPVHPPPFIAREEVNKLPYGPLVDYQLHLSSAEDECLTSFPSGGKGQSNDMESAANPADGDGNEGGK